MKRLAVLLVLFHAYLAKGQVQVDVAPIGVTITMHKDGYCKRLYTSNSDCGSSITYVPDDSIRRANPKPIYFKTEIPLIKALLDTAAAHTHLKPCTFRVDITQYDDLFDRLVAIFSSSAEWKSYLHKTGGVYSKHNPGTVSYSNKTVVAILFKYHFFKEVDNLFRSYGYKVADAEIEEPNQQIILPEDLVRLKKNKHLQVPLPDGVWVRLVKV